MKDTSKMLSFVCSVATFLLYIARQYWDMVFFCYLSLMFLVFGIYYEVKK